MRSNGEKAVKRTIKDSVFSALFNETKYLRQLCRVLKPDVSEAELWCYVKITDTLNLCFLVKSAKCTNWSHLFHGLLDNEPLMA